MNTKEALNYIKGKTIKDIQFDDFGIESIIFEDGTRVELFVTISGQILIDEINAESGEIIYIDDEGE